MMDRRLDWRRLSLRPGRRPWPTRLRPGLQGSPASPLGPDRLRPAARPDFAPAQVMSEERVRSRPPQTPSPDRLSVLQVRRLKSPKRRLGLMWRSPRLTRPRRFETATPPLLLKPASVGPERRWRQPPPAQLNRAPPRSRRGHRRWTRQGSQPPRRRLKRSAHGMRRRRFACFVGDLGNALGRRWGQCLLSNSRANRKNHHNTLI